MPDRCERVAAVGELLRAHDAGDGADAESGVAAADLAAPLDEHDTELAVAAQHTLASSARYRGSNTCSGSRACGNRTVPSGNIGMTRASVTPVLSSSRRGARGRASAERVRRPRHRLRSASRSNAFAARITSPVAASWSAQQHSLLERDPGDVEVQSAHPRPLHRVGRELAPFEVGEHASDDRMRRRRREEPELERRSRRRTRRSKRRRQPAASSARATVERITPHVAALARRARGSARACRRPARRCRAGGRPRS